MSEKEQFAIDFAHWVQKNGYRNIGIDKWYRGSYELEMGIFKSGLELMNIYQQESL